LKRFVTMHQESNNNLLIFCISEECAPSSGQDSNVLLGFVSTVILSFRPRRDPWPYFYSFKTIYVFWGGGGSPSSTSRVTLFGWNQLFFLAYLFPLLP
jgi:hypothetical protein